MTKVSFIASAILMSTFLIVKTRVLLEAIPPTPVTRATEFLCFLGCLPFFYIILKDYSVYMKSSISGEHAKDLQDLEDFVDER